MESFYSKFPAVFFRDDEKRVLILQRNISINASSMKNWPLRFSPVKFLKSFRLNGTSERKIED